MDPNLSYYSTGYLGLRMWSRGLLAFPAVAGQTTTLQPDLATAIPKPANGGLRYTVTIRTGAMWNTSPPRQVSAADVIRGLKRSCNPTEPFPGLPEFEQLIAGYESFCQAFGNVSPTDESAQVAFMASHDISGAKVSASDPLQVVFTLTRPATFFSRLLALPAFSPVPQEYLAYLPGSTAAALNTYSDGPYEIKVYDPRKSIDFVRNPVWNRQSDPIRQANVDEIKVDETSSPQAIAQTILTNTPQADLAWDSYVPPALVASEIAKKDPDFSLNPTYASDPYLVFNTISKNDNGALADPQVRRALEFAIDRSELIKDAGGKKVAKALSQVLPPGTAGAAPAYPDLYPYNPATAEQLLASAGHGSGLTFTLLYRQGLQEKLFETIQSDLAAVGVTVHGLAASNADFYNAYLDSGVAATNSAWDLALPTMPPDWYGDGAPSVFSNRFDGRHLPPYSANYGFFEDPTVDSLIDQAREASTSSQAATLWHEADIQVMQDAAIFPIAHSVQPVVHGSRVHQAVFVPALGQIDPTHVWLS
jgi:peptide/nickel transport system substrate-binding protein